MKHHELDIIIKNALHQSTDVLPTIDVRSRVMEKIKAAGVTKKTIYKPLLPAKIIFLPMAVVFILLILNYFSKELHPISNSSLILKSPLFNSMKQYLDISVSMNQIDFNWFYANNLNVILICSLIAVLFQIFILGKSIINDKF